MFEWGWIEFLLSIMGWDGRASSVRLCTATDLPASLTNFGTKNGILDRRGWPVSAGYCWLYSRYFLSYTPIYIKISSE